MVGLFVMLTRRRFGLMGFSLCALGVVGCADSRDATGAGDQGIGAAGKPSDEPELDPNAAYEAQIKQEAEEAKKRK